MPKKVTSLNTANVVNKIVSWGSKIIFVISIVILAYLSFVENFKINPSVRNITSIALIAMVLNYIVWDSNYKSNYIRALDNDLNNSNYSVHRRYYNARKGWQYNELQIRIRMYNKDFIKFWIQDVEDICGRTEEEIVKGKYFGHPYKSYIWRLKHRKYPKSGIKTPKDLLNILSVGSSGTMKMDVHKAERYYTANSLKKIIKSLLSTGLAGALIYDFIKSNWEEALLKVLLNTAILIMSLFFGSLAGINGGKMKLATAEEVSERLEEWKNKPASEEPYSKVTVNIPVIDLPIVPEVKIQDKVSIEIT